MLINDMLKSGNTELIVKDMMPLIGHLDDEDNGYGDLVSYLSEAIYQCQIIYPLPENGITVPEFIRNLRIAADTVHIPVKGIHITHSEDCTLHMPIRDNDIVVMKNAFDAIACMDPDTPHFLTCIRCIYDIANISFGNSIKNPLSDIYSKLVLLSSSMLTMKNNTADYIMAIRSFGVVYRFALKELSDYNILRIKHDKLFLPGQHNFSWLLIDTLSKGFIDSLINQITGNNDLTDSYVLSLAYERLISWAIIGDLQCDCIPYSRIPSTILAQSDAYNIKKMYWDFSQPDFFKKRSLLVAKDIIDNEKLSIIPKPKLVPHLSVSQTADPSKNTRGMSSSDIISAVGCLVPSILKDDIDFELSENELAMLASEFGAPNFRIIYDAVDSAKYIYKDPDDIEWGLFIVVPNPSTPRALAPTVYGVSMNTEVLSIIMLSGDSRYDYIYKP